MRSGLARILALAGLGAALQAGAAAGAHAEALPGAERQRELAHVVRQDCGSCHGMKLTGGLGPALTPEALADRPFDSIVASILHGRPGTPMPGWRTMLSEADARWIARHLVQGFPQESQ
jgi:cytochrome c55X